MATTYPSTGSDARERSRLALRPSSSVRLIAPGGPVSAAILAGRGEDIEAERDRLRTLAASIRTGLAADLRRIDACLTTVEAGGCA